MNKCSKLIALFCVFALSIWISGCENKKKSSKSATGSVAPFVVPADAGEYQTLPGGLKYRIIKEGSGNMPKITDKVTVHYRGTFPDGREFDSSYSRGVPATFPVNGVITGWTQALQKMKVGGQWQLIIPPELGYGSAGAGGAIPPNATLHFDVELIKIN